MGMLLPCVTAAVLNGFALQLFREPAKVGDGPLMALYIFIFTGFILLWSLRLYPRNFRRLGKLHFIIEFLIAEFIMEQLVTDFWFPLEKWVLESLPALANHIEESLSETEWSADAILDLLKSHTLGFYVSYFMAIFFLLAALHASRTVDLRTLKEEGPLGFYREIVHKIKLQKRRFIRKLGFGKKKVKINECHNRYSDVGGRSLAYQNAHNKSNPLFPELPQKIKHPCNNSGRINKLCPLHKPAEPSLDDYDTSDNCSDFEDLGKFSDSDCL
ncbi:uncharacterized protein LOC115875380 [Sitophilus oryzae]|uniref:Uncharacterized protein LOC115875380 n=1 Tax=Sitophilus oryzae TaxID=7048 RepID=A0A6J2X666_SITOR|nr:uncharacterized protein LOC115875380 [Sitophilus oryzae]